MTRDTICSLLYLKAFSKTSQVDLKSDKPQSPIVPYRELEAFFPNYPDIHSIWLRWGLVIASGLGLGSHSNTREGLKTRERVGVTIEVREPEDPLNTGLPPHLHFNPQPLTCP